MRDVQSALAQAIGTIQFYGLGQGEAAKLLIAALAVRGLEISELKQEAPMTPLERAERLIKLFGPYPTIEVPNNGERVLLTDVDLDFILGLLTDFRRDAKTL